MRFPQDFIERVRQASNLVDIIGQYVELRRTGHNHQGLCPFHNEKSPSFSVSEDKQVYHCFGCKASGNVFSFLQNYQGLSFPEAVESLAKRAAIPLPKTSSESGDAGQAKDIKSSLYRVNAIAAQFFHERLTALPPQHPVRSYLHLRGLNADLVNTYKLGYAPENWSDLADHLQSKRVPAALAETVGLIKPRTGGKNGHYDLFRQRLMFPIFSPARDCIGFGGRVMAPEQQPKYLNSPESLVFHKGRVFYGLETSIKHIRTADELIVVEGYMDWLALAKAGILNAVATLGTALTVDHARLIKRYTDKVLLLFDGDAAGRAAALRSLPILLSEGLLARGLFLPEEMDPDEFLTAHGVDRLKHLLTGAPDLFELVAEEVWQNSKGSPSGKVQALNELTPILHQTADTRLRSLYIDTLARLMDVKPSLVEQGVKKEPKPVPIPLRSASLQTPPPQPIHTPHSAPATPSPTIIHLSGLSRTEQELLNVILLKEVYLKEALATDVFAHVLHSGGRALFARIAEVYRLMPNKFDSLSALLVGEVKPSEVLTRHLSEPYSSLTAESAAKLLQDCTKRVKENFLKIKAKELVANLRGSGAAESSEKLEQIMNIQRNRRSLNRES